MLIDIKLRSGTIIGYHDVIKVEQKYGDIRIECTQDDKPNFVTSEKIEDIECLVLTMDKIPEIDCPHYTDGEGGCHGCWCDYCYHQYDQKPRPVLDRIFKTLYPAGETEIKEVAISDKTKLYVCAKCEKVELGGYYDFCPSCGRKIKSGDTCPNCIDCV